MLVRRRRRGPGLLGLTLATIVGIAGGYYIWKPAFEELRKGQYGNCSSSQIPRATAYANRKLNYTIYMRQ